VYYLIVTSSGAFAQAPRILPRLDDAVAPFWTGGADGELRIAHCGTCTHYIHPPRPNCPRCAGPVEFVAVSGDGVVFTYTVNYQSFRHDVSTPYVIALVELAEQPQLRVVANIVGCEPESVFCGMPVHVRFEAQEAVFVPLFAPHEQSD
jgi:uncharacterized OB-fold protein